MSISGNLKTMELAELLQWLSQGKKGGTLIVDSGTITKRIYFDAGRIVASGSTQPTEQLGHFLVSQGYINEVELAKAIEMQEETGMLLGKILVTIGAISEEELKNLLATQSEEILYDLFSWTEAEFRFVDGDSINRGIIPLALEVTGIILHGMGRLDEWNRIRKAIPTDRVVPVSVASLGEVEAAPSDRRILEAIDDIRTVREICLETHASEFRVSQVIFQQLRADRVKVVVPRDPEPITRTSSAGITSASSGVLPVVTARALVDNAELLIDQSSFTQAVRYLRAARSLEPDDRPMIARVTEAENRIENALLNDGLDLSAVPVLEQKVEDLTSLELSPEEGFLLTRIDGSNSIQSLLKISPIAHLDAKLVFFKLLKDGHIRLETAQ